MHIRRVTLEDLPRCVAICHVPEFTYLHRATDAEAYEYLLQFVEKGVFLIAEEHNEVVGFVTGEYMLGKFVWVDALLVVPTARRQGIGKSLFDEFRRQLKAEGIEHLYLMAPAANPGTVRFYESIGLKRGSDFVEFSLDL